MPMYNYASKTVCDSANSVAIASAPALANGEMQVVGFSGGAVDFNCTIELKAGAKTLWKITSEDTATNGEMFGEIGPVSGDNTNLSVTTTITSGVAVAFANLAYRRVS